MIEYYADKHNHKNKVRETDFSINDIIREFRKRDIPVNLEPKERQHYRIEFKTVRNPWKKKIIF